MKIARIRFPDKAIGWASVNADATQFRALAGRFEEWAPHLAAGRPAEQWLAGDTVSIEQVEILAPINPGARIFAVGRNYLEHIARFGESRPAAPTAFLMPESALVGQGDIIAYPPITSELDYEIELVAVLASALVSGRPASESLLGYSIGNDVSARDAMRLAGGRSDLFSQKLNDASTPLGPWVVTLDEFGGSTQPELSMEMRINGELRQAENTRRMIWPITSALDYIDDRIALRAGDVMFTGSPHGVGLETGCFLLPDDLIEATIEGIGTLRNRVGPKRRQVRFMPEATE